MKLQRLQKKQQELQAQYDALSEKIRRLRESIVVETNPSVKFQVERDLEQAEKDRTTIEKPLSALESQIAQFQTSPNPPSKSVKARIFLSYVQEDRAKVAELHQKFCDAGFRPWMAPKDILPGQDWKQAIRQAIQAADFFVACLSENAVAKKSFFETEISEALSIWQKRNRKDIYLLPVRLDDCEVPAPLNDLQWTDWFKEEGFNHLVTSIQWTIERKRKKTSYLAKIGLFLIVIGVIAGLIRYKLSLPTPLIVDTPTPTLTPTRKPIPPTPTPTLTPIPPTPMPTPTLTSNKYGGSGSGSGTCENVNFPINSQGKVEWPYIVKVLRQDAPVYQDATSASVASTLNFSYSLNVEDVQSERVQVKRVKTGELLGWMDKVDLLCGLSPVKGKSGLEQKFFIQTATEVRKDKPATVKAYASPMLDKCDGQCRELSRLSGYFVFDIEPENEPDETKKTYLLSEDYKIDGSTVLVGWVSGENGFVWDTAYGIRPKENLVFTDGPKKGQERAVCAYQTIEDALNDPEGKCLPILGGDRWYLSAERIPLLERVSQGGKDFYKVVLSLAGTGGQYQKEAGEIKINEPWQLTQNPGIESLTNMKKVDVLFLIDGTSSMAVYLNMIRGSSKNEQMSVPAQIVRTLRMDEAFGETQFRFGFRLYRDTYTDAREGLPVPTDCKWTRAALAQNVVQFYSALGDFKTLKNQGETYGADFFGGIRQALQDLAPCPEYTKILFIIGNFGYDAEAQSERGIPISLDSLIKILKGEDGNKNIVPFFFQIPKEKNVTKNRKQSEQAYNLFSEQAREILRQVLGPERSTEIDNYLMTTDAANLNERMLSGIKQFSNTQAINEIVLDLRGGTALKDAIERLKGSKEYNNIPGLFWDIIKQGTSAKLGLGVGEPERIYDTVLVGYIPVSDDIVEDVWLKSDDLDKYAALLSEFDPDKLASLSGQRLRETFVKTMVNSLENVIRRPLYSETGEKIQDYLRRKGGLPVRENSPLFHYSINDLEDPQAVPDCELVRLNRWVYSARQMLSVVYLGVLRPDYIEDKFSGECPSGEKIPYISADIKAAPLGNNPEMRYNHSFQKANVYWIPKEFLP